MIKTWTNNLAFSVLEVIVAIAIMVIGMLGISSLMIQSLQAGNIDKDYLTASMLAQEGLELVRNQRDLNWLTENADWYDHIIEDGHYSIDYYPLSGTQINIEQSVDSISDNGARLEIDGFGFYAHNITGGVDTNFYRLISVDDSNYDYPTDQGWIEVTCTVRFFKLGKAKDYIASYRLYPWRY